MPPPFVVGKPLDYLPLFKEQSAARDFWRRSDKARWDYAAGSDSRSYAILPKHEREPQDRYDRRLRQALVRRYARPIIDRYNDFVTREEPKRPEGTAPYKQLLEDADGAGTDLDCLLKKALRSAQVEGSRYLLADANTAGTNANAQEDKQSGKRGIIRSFAADDVIWWRDWHGSVIEAVILCADRAGGQFAWSVTEKTVQRIELKYDDKAKKWLVESIGPIIPHAYGGCPLVRLAATFDDNAIGEDSQCAPLAEGQKRICNIDSWLHEELQSCTFTTTVLLGVSADSVKEAIVGAGMLLCLPSSTGGSNPGIGKLGSDVTQAASLRDSLAYEIKELYRVAGLSSGNPTETAQPESGVAKAFAFNEIEAKCAAMADALEYAENRVVLLLSKAFGFAYPGDAEYPDRFDAPDLAQDLALCLQMEMAGLPAVLKRAQIERIAANGFELSGPQLVELSAQLDAKENAAEADTQNKVLNPAARTSGT